MCPFIVSKGAWGFRISHTCSKDEREKERKRGKRERERGREREREERDVIYAYGLVDRSGGDHIFIVFIPITRENLRERERERERE